MQIGVVGINYKFSPIEQRETFAKACSKYFGIGGIYTKRFNTILLSTCNRVEVYIAHEKLFEVAEEIKGLLQDELQDSFEIYTLFNKECFQHLALVTAGLDSAIIAETEIQNQVKKTYLSFAKEYELTKEFHFLFQKCLKIGKEVRSRLYIPRGLPNLEKTILLLCQQQLQKDLEGASFLFYGNSDINKKVISYLAYKGVKNISLCTHYKTQEVVDEFAPWGAQVFHWKEIPCWCRHEIVVFGTNYNSFILKRDKLQQLPDIKSRVFFDLSVPRNVDPSLAEKLCIPLYNIENLSDIVSEKRTGLLQEVSEAKEFLQASVSRLYGVFKEKNKRGVLCA